ncbi:predicted Zn-dependent peptidase [Sanguibacter keddieii DSM 10542]|uniref:Predicted Zn-dependent peptidase n=1 Tax=Sanguibacter keddieii (strain ATCC 51767 / DSM 10542 / NCFB 3025 / ST-74) TaxID=446469 RepID=D1BDY2_SANKS|nr:insulinase family protein [Sanguibacter keddieii]ACZ23203.1 predicted Zn-dependent peptidase [Sanguibacter keddieii DSM 10542]
MSADLLTVAPLDLVSERAPGGQLLTAVHVPGAQTVEIRVSVELPRADDTDSAHAEVLGRCLLSAHGTARRAGLLGAEVSAGADPRRLTVAASSSVEAWRTTLALLVEALAEPRATPDAVRLASGATARAALRALSSPGMLARSALHDLLWGDRAPSRFDVPTPAALGQVSAGSVTDYARRHLAGAHVSVVVGAPLVPHAAWEAAAGVLGDWSTTATRAETADLPPPGPPGSTVVEGAAPGRAGLRLMLRSPGRDHPGYAAARLSAAVLGGGPASRLSRSLRDELGVVYGVNHSTETVAREVFDVVDLELREPDVDAALGALAEAVRLPPSDGEVRRVRRRTLGAQLVARSSLAATVASVADLVADGLGPTWLDEHAEAVAAVPTEDVQADAAVRLPPDAGWRALVTPTGTATPGPPDAPANVTSPGSASPPGSTAPTTPTSTTSTGGPA